MNATLFILNATKLQIIISERLNKVSENTVNK